MKNAFYLLVAASTFLGGGFRFVYILYMYIYMVFLWMIEPTHHFPN